MGSPLQLVGKVFNRLTVVSRGEKVKNHYSWNCVCSCGNEVNTLGSSLMYGSTQSCGCLQKEAARETGLLKTTHGLSGHPLYGVYNDIKKRCYNKSCEAYSRYGGRGISMSDDWLESFENFLRDVGERPFPEATLDRRDNDGNYCKENFRWAGPDLQARNQRKYSNNTSGKTGVNLMNKNSGSPSWVGRVSCPLTGKDYSKSFSIKKFGNDEAFQLASEWRDAMLAEINLKYSAGYTDNHGK